MRLSTSVRNLRATVIYNQLNGGTLEIWSGPIPDNLEDTQTGMNLCTMSLPNPAFLGVEDGVLNKTGDWEDWGSAAAGLGTTAGYARLRDGDGNPVMDCTVSDGVGSGEIKLSSMTIIDNQPVQVASFRYTEGNR